MFDIKIFIKLQFVSFITLFFFPSGNTLLSTYNFHQPVQLHRLFKSDPREQMAMIAKSEEPERFYREEEPSMQMVSTAPEWVVFGAKNSLPQSASSRSTAHLENLDLYIRHYPMFRRRTE